MAPYFWLIGSIDVACFPLSSDILSLQAVVLLINLQHVSKSCKAGNNIVPFSSHSLLTELFTMSSSVQEISAKAQQGVIDSIPAKWRLSSEVQTPSNVMEIPKTCGILMPRQIDITEQTATELLEKLANGSLSSVEVTEAFLARAAIAHQLVFTFIQPSCQCTTYCL